MKMISNELEDLRAKKKDSLKEYRGKMEKYQEENNLAEYQSVAIEVGFLREDIHALDRVMCLIKMEERKE